MNGTAGVFIPIAGVPIGVVPPGVSIEGVIPPFCMIFGVKCVGVASIPAIGVSDGVCDGVRSQRERLFEAPGVSSALSLKSILMSLGVSEPHPGVIPPSRTDSFGVSSQRLRRGVCEGVASHCLSVAGVESNAEICAGVSSHWAMFGVLSLN
uniref:Candidate secreted effector n=1 Tax=Meloidogyne incognita TaxID=6306 RepID=A0A914NQF5_MELIC